jgi:hypothetical protein
MYARWLARELALGDKSLLGFWPLQENLLDHSGFAQHPLAHYEAGPFLRAHYGRRGFTCNAPGTGVPGEPTTFLTCGNKTPGYTGSLLDFDFSTPFTLSCWVCRTGYGLNGGGLMARTRYDVTTTSIPGWQLYLEPSRSSVWFELTAATGASVTGMHAEITVPGPALPQRGSGEWFQVVVVYRGDGKLPQMYLNGRPAPLFNTSVTSGGSARTGTAGELCLGALAGNGYVIPAATIALARAWGRALQAGEVAALYRRERDLERWDARGNTRVRSLGMTLFLQGHATLSSSTTLFVRGKDVNTGSIPLVTVSWPHEAMGLYLHVATTPLSAGLTAYVLGSTPGWGGWQNASPLSITGSMSEPMGLFILGPASDTLPRHMNLAIAGGMVRAEGAADLFICNTLDGHNVAADLFIAGTGDFAGGLPASKGMPLYIERTPVYQQLGTMTLLIQPKDSLIGTATLYTNSNPTAAAGVGLVVPAIIEDLGLAGALYTSGF